MKSFHDYSKKVFQGPFKTLAFGTWGPGFKPSPAKNNYFVLFIYLFMVMIVLRDRGTKSFLVELAQKCLQIQKADTVGTREHGACIHCVQLFSFCLLSLVPLHTKINSYQQSNFQHS